MKSTEICHMLALLPTKPIHNTLLLHRWTLTFPLHEASPPGNPQFSDLPIPGYPVNFESMNYCPLPSLPFIGCIPNLGWLRVCSILQASGLVVLRQDQAAPESLDSRPMWSDFKSTSSSLKPCDHGWVMYLLCAFTLLICKQEVFRFVNSLNVLIHIKQSNAWHRINSKQSTAIITSSPFSFFPRRPPLPCNDSLFFILIASVHFTK